MSGALGSTKQNRVAGAQCVGRVGIENSRCWGITSRRENSKVVVQKEKGHAGRWKESKKGRKFNSFAHRSGSGRGGDTKSVVPKFLPCLFRDERLR